jgi:putative ABC transport system ATP-binding protein
MIHTQGLRYGYPGATDDNATLVFPDVSVAQGEVLLLSGPSGCGKSTWLSLVAALVQPTAGELMVTGQDLSALNNRAADAWRAKTVGFLPQKLHLSSALTVQDNLALAFWATGSAADSGRIHDTLQSLGVAELAGRRPHQLSGGQAQRVALARAVLQHPQVLLADEPTASLDDDSAADAVGLLLSTARAHGSTLVIATHDARVQHLIAEQNSKKNSLLRLSLLKSTLSIGEQPEFKQHQAQGATA